ncbi:MAG: RNA 3'-phosphate cyclase, partial [Undibacterium sp.]|nr:RNA 3'-phosphate cyclase [Undibacterium sp.]
VNRPKPGLMRQHLVAVQAAAQICHGEIASATVGAQTLEFRPGKIQSGAYQFAIGTAGSCTLVLQTLIPALLYADGASTIHITGGTHNMMAPPAHFLQRSYARVLADMGATLEIELKRFGFYPAGGGEIFTRIRPCTKLNAIKLMESGARIAGYAESFIAGIPVSVANRELESVGAGMGWNETQLFVRGLSNDQGPGNALLMTLEQQNVINVFSEFGEKMVRSETVARNLLAQVRRFMISGATVGENLADQIMLPFALAGGGRFTTNTVTQHAQTNAKVIAQFLPVDIRFEKRASYYVCSVEPRNSLTAPKHF